LLLVRNTPRRAEDNRKIRRRWEKVLVYVEDKGESLSDEEWSDLLRRCLTWYCRDEMGINPYTWLTEGAGFGESARVSGFREYFMEVLNQEGVGRESRSGYVARFRELIRNGANA
jgi:hypothetical protein